LSKLFDEIFIFQTIYGEFVLADSSDVNLCGCIFVEMKNIAMTQRIGIKLKNFDYRPVDQSVMEIVDTTKHSRMRAIESVSLAICKEHFIMNHSPNFDKSQWINLNQGSMII
jgi:hypothetical protein